MALSTRWIFVDDTDSSITYRGPWSQSSEDVENGDVSGPIYGGSQRYTNGTASLTYTFSGEDLLSPHLGPLLSTDRAQYRGVRDECRGWGGRREP